MQDGLKNLDDRSYLFGENAYYVEELYARYLKNPESVSDRWRAYFSAIQDGVSLAQEREAAAMRTPGRVPPAAPKVPSVALTRDTLKQAAVLRLINVYRVRGHQQADIDPLRLRPRPAVPDLDPEFHNLSEGDMDTVF